MTTFGELGFSNAAIPSLAEKGFNIDRKTIIIKDPVKEVGTYKATVRLHKEVSAEITFEVIAEGAEILGLCPQPRSMNCNVYRIAAGEALLCIVVIVYYVIP